MWKTLLGLAVILGCIAPWFDKTVTTGGAFGIDSMIVAASAFVSWCYERTEPKQEEKDDSAL